MECFILYLNRINTVVNMGKQKTEETKKRVGKSTTDRSKINKRTKTHEEVMVRVVDSEDYESLFRLLRENPL